MLIKITVHVVAMALSIVTATHSVAMERLNGEKFKKACLSYEPNRSQPGAEADKALCYAFLMGYLAASERIFETEKSEKRFHDKVMETRVRGLLRRDRRLQERDYCLSGEESVEKMVSRINEIKLEKDNARFAENVVESVLIKYYLCPD